MLILKTTEVDTTLAMVVLHCTVMSELLHVKKTTKATPTMVTLHRVASLPVKTKTAKATPRMVT